MRPLQTQSLPPRRGVHTGVQHAIRLLVRPVCPQSTSEAPTYKGESWWGLKPPVPRKAVRVWSVDPTFPSRVSQDVR